MFIAYLAGLLTLPALFGLFVFLNWAFSRTRAYGKCLACDHLEAREIGDNYNIIEWMRGAWHDIWWSRRSWHRASVKAYWAKYQ